MRDCEACASGSYKVVPIGVAPKRSVPLELTEKRSWRTPWKKKSKPMRVTAEAVSSWSAATRVVVPLLMSVSEAVVVVAKT